jgi:hypothetical protein
MAGGCGVADGPAPIGDIIGGGIIVCALIYDIYVCTRPDPDPEPLPPPVPPKPRCPKDDEDETCAEKYPGYVSCGGFTNSGNAGALAGKYGGSTCKKKKANKCGAGGGDHYMWGPKGNQTGSILCCNCCDDSTGKAITKYRCKFTAMP